MISKIDSKIPVTNTSIIKPISSAPIKVASINFMGYDSKEGFQAKEINDERLSLLISQKVPAKKICQIYNDMLDVPDQSFLEKVMTIKTKISRSIHRKFAPELVEENMLYGFAQAIGSVIPDCLKIDRKDEFFDIPYQANSSIINIINSTDNFDDFYDSIELYGEQMAKFGYDKDSDLPTVLDVKSKGNYITLIYDKELSKQEKTD